MNVDLVIVDGPRPAFRNTTGKFGARRSNDLQEDKLMTQVPIHQLRTYRLLSTALLLTVTVLLAAPLASARITRNTIDPITILTHRGEITDAHQCLVNVTQVGE